MGDDAAGERHGPDIFRPHICLVLGRGQQGMQHLEGRLEHLDKFQESLGRPVKAATVRISIGVVLAEIF